MTVRACKGRKPEDLQISEKTFIGGDIWGGGGGDGEERYRLSMSETISTSSSAAAIFSADDSCGRPPNKNDMVYDVGLFGVRL